MVWGLPLSSFHLALAPSSHLFTAINVVCLKVNLPSINVLAHFDSYAEVSPEQVGASQGSTPSGAL